MTVLVIPLTLAQEPMVTHQQMVGRPATAGLTSGLTPTCRTLGRRLASSTETRQLPSLAAMSAQLRDVHAMMTTSGGMEDKVARMQNTETDSAFSRCPVMPRRSR